MDAGDSPLGPADQQRISDAVKAVIESRVVIEQAKGMLMFVYGVDDTEAFDMMRTQSQRHNIKLRLIAEQIRKDLVQLSKARGPARRLAFDGLMLTAHQRISTVAARQLDGQCKTGVRPLETRPAGGD